MTSTFTLHTGETCIIDTDHYDCEVVVEGHAHLVLSESDLAAMMLCWREAIAYLRREDW